MALALHGPQEDLDSVATEAAPPRGSEPTPRPCIRAMPVQAARPTTPEMQGSGFYLVGLCWC